jgi:hypothetical protein
MVQILLGIGMLFFGRRLYWAVVGAFGFLAATSWAFTAFQNQPEWVLILIGLAAGLVGALLAIYVGIIGIGLAGFLGGAILTMGLVSMLNLPQGGLEFILPLVGGILGSILMYMIFDWALILLSAVNGALLLANGLPVEGIPASLVAIGLAIIGVLVQANLLGQLTPATNRQVPQ